MMNEEIFFLKTKAWPMWLKSYQVVFEDLKISDKEFEELIDFFTSIEEYKVCDNLIKKNKNNSLSNVAQ
jgi:hypothetical protein